MNFKQFSQSTAYVFDLDDTLITSGAKAKVVRGEEVILTDPPKHYPLKSGETLDLKEFGSIEILKKTAKKTVFWKTAQGINDGVKDGDEIFILTARNSDIVKNGLNAVLREMGLSELKPENTIAIGDNSNSSETAAIEKQKVLRKLAKEYDIVKFFDDSERNIEKAKQVPNVEAILIKN